jgi:peroxiredoxin
MKTLRRVTLVLALGLILAPRGVPAADPANLNTIKEGDSVPAFTGRNFVGDEIDVGELLGKEVVVLAFWSIYCKPCVEEVSSLIRLQEEFGEEIEVIGINTDTELGVERIRKFISRFEEFEGKKINYENIFDEGNKISKLLGVSFLPTVLSVNTRGQVEKVFVRFEEKTEEEIFTGIRSILPSAEETTDAAEEDTMTFTVQAVAPLCGFYGTEGWIGSFTGNHELEDELDKARETAQGKATKLILKEALLALGIDLAEDSSTENCFSPYGVYLLDDPMKIQDNLTNLINELPLNRLIRTLETQEDFLGTKYRVGERSRVNMAVFRGILDTLGYETTPRTVTFSVVNINKLDQEMFEQILLRQSRFIGYYSFPTYTIYTTVDTFADEMEKMDLQGLRLFIEDISEDRIELEVWR